MKKLFIYRIYDSANLYNVTPDNPVCRRVQRRLLSAVKKRRIVSN